MSFEHEELRLGRVTNFVWERDPLMGNLVIVVIDDQCQLAMANPENSDEVPILEAAALSRLREYACSWEKTRAIGFFRLMASVDNADKVLELIHKWLDKITDSDTQVYFLVDALYSDAKVGVAVPHIMRELTELYPPRNRIAYLTKGGNPVLGDLPPGYTIFQKGSVADWAQRHEELSPDMMSFFGLTS